MKNIFLFIILGLITIGCELEDINGVIVGTGNVNQCEDWQDCEEVDEWWICAETYEDEPWWVYSSEELCLEYCEGECIIREE
jgi:hypothetical protein